MSSTRNLLIAVCAAAAAMLVTLARPCAATDVSGEIGSDTHWTISQSPYRLISNVWIDNNATLTIDPGVAVLAAGGFRLIVGTAGLGPGRLLALATPAQPILFAAEAPTASHSDWQGIQVDYSTASCLFENCAFRDGAPALTVGVAGSPLPIVTACSFFNNSTALFLGGSALARPSDLLKLANCDFDNNATAIYHSVYAEFALEVRESRFTHNAACFYGYKINTFRNAEFTQNTGVILYGSGPFCTWNLDCCSIHDNASSACIRGGVFGAIDGLDMYGNTGFTVYRDTSSPVSLPNVWWGTTDIATIQASIFDCHDDFNLGCVSTNPISTGVIGCRSTTEVPMAPRPNVAAHGAPNPFRNRLALSFTVPRAGHVVVDVFAADGRHVKRLIDSELPAGPQSVVWDVDRSLGRGVYFYKVSMQGTEASGKLVRLDR